MNEPFWGKVELMGHVAHVGRISEEEKFGGKLGRVDVPRGDGSYGTVYFGAGSVYRISVLTEDIARQMGPETAAPISPWDLPRRQEALPAPHSPSFRDSDEAYADMESDDDDDESPPWEE